jgi:uncharacterized protein YqeY
MPIRARLKRDLLRAMKQRDQIEVATIRSLLADIANAEAVTEIPASHSLPASAAPMGTAGLSNDLPRRDLSSRDIVEILRADVRDRRTALADYEQHGQRAQADRARAELAVIGRYVEIAEAESAGSG